MRGVPTRACSATAGEEHLADRAQEDLDVEPERPVLDVVVVEPGAVGDRGVAAQAADLGQPVRPARTRWRVAVAGELGGELARRSAGAPGGARPASCRRAGCSTAAAARRARCGAGTGRPARPARRRRPTTAWPTRPRRRPHRRGTSGTRTACRRGRRAPGGRSRRARSPGGRQAHTWPSPERASRASPRRDDIEAPLERPADAVERRRPNSHDRHRADVVRGAGLRGEGGAGEARRAGRRAAHSGLRTRSSSSASSNSPPATSTTSRWFSATTRSRSANAPMCGPNVEASQCSPSSRKPATESP